VGRQRGPAGSARLGQFGTSASRFLYDLSGDDAGRWEVVGVVQVLVMEPEDVETGLVLGGRSVVAKSAESLALVPLPLITGLEARFEMVQVGSGEGCSFSG
jgi:hypothetical protein